MNKSQKILQFVKDSGYDGRRFTDIQRFICELNGHDYDEFATEYGDHFIWTTEEGRFSNRYNIKNATHIYQHEIAEGEFLFSKGYGKLHEIIELFHGKVWSEKKLAPVRRRVMRGYYCVSLQTILAHCKKWEIPLLASKKWNKRYHFFGPIPRTIHTQLAKRTHHLEMQLKYQNSRMVNP